MVGPAAARCLNQGITGNPAYNDLCARATGVALGLPPGSMGDAAQAKPALTRLGYQRLPGNTPPKPDDIGQWVHSFGRNNRQHMGFYGVRSGEPVVISNDVYRWETPDYLWRKANGPAELIVGTGKPRKPSFGSSVRARRPQVKKPSFGSPVRAKRPAKRDYTPGVSSF